MRPFLFWFSNYLGTMVQFQRSLQVPQTKKPTGFLLFLKKIQFMLLFLGGIQVLKWSPNGKKGISPQNPKNMEK